jgi:hypothetical protein
MCLNRYPGLEPGAEEQIHIYANYHLLSVRDPKGMDYLGFTHTPS